MITSKVIVIAVAALFIGGATVAVAFWPEGESGKGGWYSWDPAVGEVDYSKISATPKIIDAIEGIYGIVYGDLPEKVSVPEGSELTYASLVEHTDDGITINGARRGAGGTPTATPVSFTTDEIKDMRIISYGLGFTDSYVQMLGADVWDSVVAAGNTTWNGYSANGMAGGTLGSEYTLSVDSLNAFFKDRDGWEDETFCLVVWGYITNYDALMTAISAIGGNVKVLCIDYYAITSLGYLLSVVDALGQLVGIDTADNASLSDFQDRLYSMTASITENDLTVYMELPAGTSPGTGTLTQLCFDVLELNNINKTAGTSILSDEVVVTSMPDVILFDVKDTRTMDQRMRLVT
ncbi:MAG: hypothetical protein FWD81_02565 [Methanomassiliicoccaceae archaeon]|nr:hypothetical protein [Methanomassiliicoccaceae archaeon]